ncbi:MAG: chemotaxis response regulator protein-glutamate methylesterase [Lachnospiraceae bacterium]|nr:chemotaxis response regulator protein-glutamate methylesterase [Lachnospiraceae bacterium]
MIKKVLAIDDSALMRRVLSDIIASDERFVLEDSAVNGLEAYDMIVSDQSKYDLIILDINMPRMNGIELLERLVAKGIKIPTLVVSTIAREGADETIRCLELGAFDFLTKPGSFMETKSERFRERLLSLMAAGLSLPDSAVKELPSRRVHEHVSPKEAGEISPVTPSAATAKVLGGPMSYTNLDVFNRKPHTTVSKNATRLVAIASSTGGPKALQQVLPLLPPNLAAPVVLVQHMPESFTGSLASRMNEISKINVKEAENGDILKKGWVYIAKGGRHLRIEKKGSEYVLVFDNSPARNGLRPCADIMYESIKELDFDEITCVVLTGMGSDGTRGIGGLSEVKNTYVIAQDEASSTVYGMPRMIKEAGVTDEILPLGEIAEAIVRIVGTC